MMAHDVIPEPSLGQRRSALRRDTDDAPDLDRPFRPRPHTTFDETCLALGLEASTLEPRTRAAIETLVSELNLLREEADALELALDQAQSLADHDPLIPMFNRRAFLRELSRSLSFCARYQADACLIYLDLDRFKALNDRLGHSAGDEALQKVGRILITHTRESDLIGRLGGDEFGIVLINAGLDGAKAKAGQLIADVQAITIGSHRVPADISASCGVVMWSPGETRAQFLGRADEAMYAEKLARREAR